MVGLMDTINEEYSDGAALGRACKSHQLATIGNDFGALVCYVALLVSTPQWGRTALACDMRPQTGWHGDPSLWDPFFERCSWTITSRGFASFASRFRSTRESKLWAKLLTARELSRKASNFVPTW